MLAKTIRYPFNRKDIDLFIEQANTFHPTIKFTTEISEKQITFLDMVVYKGERFLKEAILDVKTHYKPTETFQYTHYSSGTHQALREALLKEKKSDFLEQTSRKKFPSGHVQLENMYVVTQKTYLKVRYQRPSLPDGSQSSKNKPNRLKAKLCLL